MGRPLRDFHAGIYHVAAHGSDRRYLYVDDLDRSDFLERLHSALWPRGIELLAYVLMGNHYHALVQIPDARLSKALQRLHTDYSRQHNRRHRRGAHLFRAHCLARRLDDDNQLLTAYRYLAHNPIAAGLARHPLEWPWSSAPSHAGLRPAPIPITHEPLKAALDHSAGWRRRYRELVDPSPPGLEGEIERGGNLRFPPLGLT
jgi:putative transposase